VPIWFHWDGRRFVLASGPTAPKVKALMKSPKVALTVDENGFPPKVLLVRGTATTKLVDGVIPEYSEAAVRYLGEEQGRAWQQQAGGMFKQMARIEIEPEWVKILDFQTRFPKAIEDALRG
jgi:Pyridoxamine 5'-phosphate oxidase